MNRNENAHMVDPSVGAGPDEVEVAVVGVGPVGLTAAAMLAGYGVRVAVLDGAAGPAPYSRAAVVHVRTMETLAPLGVVDEMVQGEASWFPTSAYATATGVSWQCLSATCPPLTRTA